MYLNQFGISSKPRVKKPVNILRDYHRSSEVVYFKAKVNSKSRMHVAFMKIDEWVDYVSRVYDKEVNVACGRWRGSFMWSICTKSLIRDFVMGFSGTFVFFGGLLSSRQLLQVAIHLAIVSFEPGHSNHSFVVFGVLSIPR